MMSPLLSPPPRDMACGRDAPAVGTYLLLVTGGLEDVAALFVAEQLHALGARVVAVRNASPRIASNSKGELVDAPPTVRLDRRSVAGGNDHGVVYDDDPASPAEIPSGVDGATETRAVDGEVSSSRGARRRGVLVGHAGVASSSSRPTRRPSR